MKRKFKKSLAAVLAAALVVGIMPSVSADAAKKPKLNKKKASVNVGATVKIKVKNGKKSAKVTWKTSNKKVAKIAKKSTKGKSAYATVKGVKPGKANITAVYKVGSKKQNLKCKVTVKKAPINTVTNAPVITQTTAPAAVVTPSPVVTATTAPVQTTAPSNKPTPTKRPTATPTKKPTPTPVPSPDATVYKTSKDIVIDGDLDSVWEFAADTEQAIDHWAPEADGMVGQTSNAKARMLYTDDNFYLLVTADDPEIDLTREEDYRKDSIEIFFDEFNYKVEYGSSMSTAFQYRLVLNENPADDVVVGSLTDRTDRPEDAAPVESAFKITKDAEGKATGYICEFKIPLTQAPVEKGFCGVDVQINDASAGDKTGTWTLFSTPETAAADDIPYNTTAVFGDCQFMVKKEAKVIELALDSDHCNMQKPDQFMDNEEYAAMNSESRIDDENKWVYCNTANNLTVYFPEGRTVLNGEDANIEIKGTYVAPESGAEGEEDTAVATDLFRIWMVDTNNRALTGDHPITTSEQPSVNSEALGADENGDFTYTVKLTAQPGDKAAEDGYESNGKCDGLMIKAPSWNGMIGNVIIKSVIITVYDPVEFVEPENPGPSDPVTGPAVTVTGSAYTVDLSVADNYAVDDAAGSATATYNAESNTLDVSLGQYTGLIVKADDATDYKAVKVTYTSAGALDGYLFDSEFIDGKGQFAAGQQGPTGLVATDEEKTVVLPIGTDFVGDCIKATKFVNMGGATTIKIKSVEFLVEDPTIG